VIKKEVVEKLKNIIVSQHIIIKVMIKLNWIHNKLQV